MKNFTLKVLMMACFFLIAGYVSAQFRIETNAQNGSEVTVDDAGAKHWIYHYNTTQTLSYATLIDTTGKYDIGLKSFRNRNGYQANVYDETDTVVINNGNRFKMPKYTGGDNICHFSSLESLISILDAHYVNDTNTSVSSLKPATGLFDVEEGNSAFGAYPGKYKKVEYGFYLRFNGYSLNEDVTFDIMTYDEGMNLGGATASYELSVYLGSDSGDPAATVADFYTTGSGTMNVSLAAATGLNVADFSNNSVYILLKTAGSGTAIADTIRDPMIVVDNIAATLVPAIWIEPAVAENQIGNNAEAPLEGVIGVDTKLGIPLKIEGRLGSLKITDNLYLNGVGDKTKKPLTFLDSLAVMANDGNGNYTVEVPYTLEPAAFDGENWSNQKITIDAPDAAVNDDMMLYFNAMPTAATYSARLEMDCGTRIWYDIFVQGTGASVIDLTGVDDGYILADTLGGVPANSRIVLAPGKMYNVGGYSIDKSLEFVSSDPQSENKPHLFCDSNFDMIADSSVAYIVFRNIHFSGDFSGDYIMNVSKQSSIGDFILESCSVKSLRGVVRIKDNPSTIENFIVTDCVMDSVNNYGLLTMDKEGGAVNTIAISNSTFSHFTYFIVSRNNSNSLTVKNSTFFAVPEKGRQLFRYRGGDGANDITSGLSIQKSYFGHGWNMSGEEDYGIKGMEGLTATSIEVKQTVVTDDFSYSSDSIPGLGSDVYAGSSMDLWVDPMNGNFNLKDKAYAGYGLGDPRWVYEYKPPTELTLMHSYTFDDGTAADVVGGADGMLEGDASVSDGMLNLTGSGFVSLPAGDISVPSYDNITIEGVIKQADGITGSFTAFASFGDVNPTTDWMGINYIILQPTREDNDRSRTSISCLNTTDPWATENGVNGDEITDNETHHWVTVVTNSEIKLYIDGVLIGSDALTGNNSLANIGNSVALIGKDVYPNDPLWKGTIDELNIWSGEMDAATIERRANRVLGIPTLMHSYTFEDGTANDMVGTAHGTLEGDATVSDGALNLTGNGFVSLPAEDIDVPSYSTVSFEGIIKQADGITGSFTAFASFGDVNPTTDWMGINYIILQPTREDNDRSRTSISCLNTTEPWASENGVNGDEIVDNATHHWVTVVTDSEIKLYIDGVLVGTDALTGDNSLANVGNSLALIGKDVYPNDPLWKGMVKELNIYEGELDSAFIAQRYNDFTTGISNVEFSDAEIKVYPTYTSGNFTVETDGNSGMIKVYSLVGKLVIQKTIESSRETVSIQNEGMYIMKVESDDVAKTFKVFKTK